MITTYDDYILYLNRDRIALGIDNSRMKAKIKNWLFPNMIYKFQKTLRKYEYISNCRKSLIYLPLKIYYKRKFSNISLKLGFSIPINVFGAGLAIVHYGTIIVSPYSKIGENCRIHAGTNIGASGGTNLAPIIGKNCYIGPGAKIYGGIEIPDNCAISANAVVNKSIYQEGKMLAGIPAQIIKDIDISLIIKHI